MKLSIQKIFFNLKMALIVLTVGVSVLSIQLINISQYSDHLNALKNQHFLIKKIMASNLNDLSMATITLNGDISELALFTKLSTNKAFLDFIFTSKENQDSLDRALLSASTSFQEAALFWIESMPVSREAMYQRMVSARNLYLVEIDQMMDHQVQRINDSIAIAKITVLFLLLLTIATFLFYRWRLNQIYRDINQACSLDTDGAKLEARTDEINFIVKRLARRMPTTNTNPLLLHPLSGINSEKGMHTSYAAKRSHKKSTNHFLIVFEIEQYASLSSSLSKEEMGGIFKKLGEIIAMYEQPLDIIAHLDDDRFAFLMSRNTKESALSEVEKIISSVSDSIFATSQGAIKITLSAGFIVKIPAKSLEDSLLDVKKVTERAKNSGGNRVAQLRDQVDTFR
ncbi:MAG: diguanylate cyclase [Sulfuricurvum sp.]|nr:diguanylate cyclase [Sulfuricurvum sp.]